MKKRGRAQGNIELILSFVIFVGFILVMLVFLNPLRNTQTSYVSLDKVQDKLIENLSIEYGFLALRINSSVGLEKNCFKFDYNSSWDKVLILSSNGSFLDIDKKKNDKSMNFNKVSDNFYNLYFSEEFNNHSASISGCYVLKDDEYVLGALKEDRRILYENIALLNKSYFENYKSLKNSLLLEQDFDFIVYNSSKYVLFDTTNVHKAKTGNVLARDIPLMAIDKDAQDKSLIISLRVW